MDYSHDFYVNKALTLEKQFSQNKYFGTREAGLFQYIEGNIPVILSAPHTVRQIRNGTHKKADIFTGSLGIILQELTNCHLIYRTYTGKGDANRDIECPYKAQLMKKITDNNILYLIDLHGMGENREFDIDIGTLRGKSIETSLEKIILNSFFSFNIKDVRFDYLFDADKEGTVTNTIWNNLSINSFQIEINAIYRNLKVKKNHPNFLRLIRSIEQLILSLG
ncbi:hypothetical protein [Alkaliphilus hydrothermalis]|uniref:N-formylglutamate amidohydrolase n=1 Tax=Alkaliphilus hydrothermalis TaxID=1482730 RepID=A0ABS2NM95_9FIRM|nr:hypothetical protein [Alkaliphilus hydrothermalis]MBM7614075.1 hypothetical protein [Alkaliphilus hydrothermalis]